MRKIVKKNRNKNKNKNKNANSNSLVKYAKQWKNYIGKMSQMKMTKKVRIKNGQKNEATLKRRRGKSAGRLGKMSWKKVCL